MRIATGGILHETSTFSPVPTLMQDWESGIGLLRGPAVLDQMRGVNWGIWGFMQVAEREGIELLPLLWTFAYPAAPTPHSVYETLVTELIDRLRAALPVDGVLLELHGAGVAEGVDCMETDQLRRVREVVGPDVPVMAVLDIHCNISPGMVELADALVVYENYPHTDIAERGIECAEVMVKTLRGARPTMAHRHLPMRWAAARQVTAHPPMNRVIERLHALKARPDVLTASVHTGFDLADLPFTGAGVVVVTDNDPALARRLADEFGDWLWAERATWQADVPTPEEALDMIEAAGRYPAILADQYDNTGGGAPGDSTAVLRLFRERGLRDAAILYLADPEVAQAAHAAGVGATITVDVGGKASPLQGEPVRMTLRVEALSDGVSRYDGPMYAGGTARLGPSAHLVEDGLHLIVVSARMQPLDLAFSRDLGLDCRQMRYICVKSAVHFRSGFEAIAGHIINVAAPSVHNPKTITHRRLPRPFYPLDEV